MRVYHYILGILFLLPTCLEAQNSFDYIAFDFHNRLGLKADEVFGIAQDKNGVLWIGSSKGIFRFNGSETRLYGREQGVISQFITRVYLLKDNSILAIGEHPYATYIIDNEHLTIQNVDKKLELKGGHSCLANDSSGVFIYSDSQKVILFTDKDSTTLMYDSLFFCSYLFHSPSNELRTLVQIPEWHEQKEPIIQKVHHGVKLDTSFHVFVPGPNNSVYSASRTIIASLKKESVDTLAHFEKNASTFNPNYMVMDKDGGLWISDILSGLYYWHPNNSEIMRVDSLIGIPGIQVTSLFNDEEDNIWVSTLGKGVKCLKKSVFKSSYLKDGLTNGNITSLLKYKTDELYIGTASGFNILNLKNEKIAAYPSFGYIRNMTTDWENHVYAFITQKKPKVLPRELDHFRIPLANYTSAYQTDSNTIVTSTWAALKYFKDSVSLSGKAPIEHIKFYDRVRKYALFQQTEMVLASDSLFRRTDQGFKAVPIPVLPKNPPNLEFFDLLVTGESEFWIASSQGLIRWHEDKWEYFNELDGLSDNLCTKLEYEESEQRLWIATPNGLCCYWKGRFIIYTQSDGLSSNEINIILNDDDHDCIWVGTSSGLNRLNKKDITFNINPLRKVSIDQIEIVGDTLIFYPENLELARDQKHLKIHFATPHYFGQEELEYQYRLEGFDENWINISSKVPYAEFFALNSGEYIFWIRNRKRGAPWGVSNSLKFSIATPFWKSYWFFASIAILFTFSTIAFAQMRIRRIRLIETQKRETLSAFNQLELQAFHYSMNPHFLFNSLNSIQQFISKYRDALAIDFVSEFSLLVRNNLEALRKGWIPLKTEIEQLERYLKLESHRLNKNLSFEILVDKNINTNNIDVPPLFIQPFIENSIWHGIAPKKDKTNSFIHIGIESLDSDFLKVTIQDNGIGLSASKANKKAGHESRGIELTRKRLELLSRENTLEIIELRDSKGISSGTSVTIQFYIDS